MKILNKALDLLNRKPQASYIQPKSLNVNFSNSIDNKFTVLNLNNYDRFFFDIAQKKDTETNFFILQAKLTKLSKEEIVELAIFETKKEAEEALLIIKNKLYGTDKKVLKVIIMLVFINIVWGLFNDIKINTENSVSKISSLTQNMSPEDIAKIEAQYQEMQNQPPQPQQAQPIIQEVPQESGNPEVNNFLNKLN